MPRRRRPPRPGALADLAPLRILSQILILQAGYYASALVLIVFTALAAGRTMSLDLILGWRTVRGDVTEGWMMALCWMLNSLVGVVYLLLLVARSKLVPDFALTLHFIHLVITSSYSKSLPTAFFWWVIQFCSISVMVFLGMWSCQWRELKPMAFGAAATAADDQINGVNGDDSVDHERGNGSGRGRDGHGIYEMLPIKKNGIV